jgi:hypothetical protein
MLKRLSRKLKQQWDKKRPQRGGTGWGRHYVGCLGGAGHPVTSYQVIPAGLVPALRHYDRRSGRSFEQAKNGPGKGAIFRKSLASRPNDGDA